eukprot:29520-Prymnesium_polylepis.1
MNGVPCAAGKRPGGATDGSGVREVSLASTCTPRRAHSMRVACCSVTPQAMTCHSRRSHDSLAHREWHSLCQRNGWEAQRTARACARCPSPAPAPRGVPTA